MKTLYILMILAFCSCYTKYKVSKNRIKANSTIADITIYKVGSIKSTDKWGIPEKATFDRSFTLVHTPGAKVSKKISFFKETPGYVWVNGKDTVKILPQEFSTAGWYYISGIPGYDRAPQQILYQRDEKGRIKQYSRNYFEDRFR